MPIYRQKIDSMFFKAGTLWITWGGDLIVPHSELVCNEDFNKESHKQIHLSAIIDFDNWFEIVDKQDYSKCNGNHDYGEPYKIKEFIVVKCKKCGFNIDPKFNNMQIL